MAGPARPGGRARRARVRAPDFIGVGERDRHRLVLIGKLRKPIIAVDEARRDDVRQPVGDDPAKPKRIKSVRGVGYILAVDP